MNTRFSYTDKQKVKHEREIVGEFYQYGRRIYDMVDPKTKKPHTGIADEIDKTFFPQRSAVLPRNKKGFIGLKKKRGR